MGTLRQDLLEKLVFPNVASYALQVCYRLHHPSLFLPLVVLPRGSLGCHAHLARDGGGIRQRVLNTGADIDQARHTPRAPLDALEPSSTRDRS
jgi:hypothetical protein